MSKVQVAVTHPSSLAIAWMAGIIEGEGWIGKDRTTSEIIVVQKDDWILWKIQELFGGTVSTYRQKKTGNDYYKWVATGARARGIIMTIYPFLSPRRQEKAKLAIDKHGQPTGRPLGTPWTDKDYEARRK